MNTENISEREGLERLENLVEEQNYKEASAFASDLRDRYPSSFQIGFLYYGILVKLEKYSESESVLDELLKLYPENINLLLEKGELLIGRGKTAESKLFFDKVLFLDPFNNKAKEGVEKVKGYESGGKSDSGLPENVILDDTMKESDLERFMSGDGDEAEIVSNSLVEDSEDELDISLSESGTSFNTGLEGIDFTESSDDILKTQDNDDKEEVKPSRQPTVKSVDNMTPSEQDDTEIPVKEFNATGKVESALEELNKFSSSDMSDLGLDEGVEGNSIAQIEEVKGLEEEAFVTESAAQLYLKQGLYEDAKSVYSKLYKGSNENLFNEKVDKIRRIEKANLKIIALEGFLEKIRTGSVRIV